jgi:hypothetical protein
MGAPYSQDLRERVISVVDGGMRAYEAAPLLRVSVSYIYKALGRRRATGETTARPSGRGPSPKLAPHDDALRQRIAEEPDRGDTGVAAGHARREGQCRLLVEAPAPSRFAAQKKSLRAAEQDRADVAKAHVEWRAGQGDMEPERMVFIDESGASTKMTRLYGRCARGKRLVCAVPHGHWKTTTFIGALRQRALRHRRPSQRRDIPRMG